MNAIPKIEQTASSQIATAISQPKGLSAAKLLAYAAVYLGWGTTYLAIRVGIRDIGPASFLSLRFLIAALVLVSVVLVRGGHRSLTMRQIGHSSLQGLLLLIGGLLPIAYAEKTLSSSVVAMVIGCAPIGFAVFDRLLNKAPIYRKTIFGCALGTIGVCLLGTSLTAGPIATPEGLSIGLPLVLVGTILWCFASVFGKRLAPARDSITHVTIQYLAAGLALAAIAYGYEGFSSVSLAGCGPNFWYSLAYLALVPSVLSYTSYMWLLKSEPSSRVATYALVNPVVAVVSGALLLHEAVSPLTVMSLLIIISGTYYTIASKKNQKTPAAEANQ